MVRSAKALTSPAARRPDTRRKDWQTAHISLILLPPDLRRPTIIGKQRHSAAWVQAFLIRRSSGSPSSITNQYPNDRYAATLPAHHRHKTTGKLQTFIGIF